MGRFCVSADKIFIPSFYMQKRPCFVFQRNKVFSFFLFKISHAEDKDFYPLVGESEIREQRLFLHFSFILQKAKTIILFLSPFPLPKLKRRRIKRKKK
jgi:hypothetical protein